MSETTISLRNVSSEGRIYGYFVLVLFSFLLSPYLQLLRNIEVGGTQWKVEPIMTYFQLRRQGMKYGLRRGRNYIRSQDGGLSWSPADVITSSDLSMSDSGFGSILVTSSGRYCHNQI